MFTGIIEALGTVTDLTTQGSNLRATIQSPISDELKIDQSIAHNGVCLTVIERSPGHHTVDIIDESIKKSNFDTLEIGHRVNLERCLQMGGRLDGHMVQGHVDTTMTCIGLESLDGSWRFRFELDPANRSLVIPQGSICLNGVSLTLSDVDMSHIEVSIIPYTYEHTVFKDLLLGARVNVEFDMIGKYLQRYREVIMEN